MRVVIIHFVRLWRNRPPLFVDRVHTLSEWVCRKSAWTSINSAVVPESRSAHKMSRGLSPTPQKYNSNNGQQWFLHVDRSA